MREVEEMKYCPRCGSIYSDQSDDYDREDCLVCGYQNLEEDDMTSEKYDQLTEEEKDEYEIRLVEIIKSSPVFDERGSFEYGTADFYFSFRFDKYEEMTGKRANRKWTPEYREEMEKKWEAELKECREKYGPGTAYYEAEKRREAAEEEEKRRREDPNVLHCPFCNSIDISLIPKFEKLVKIQLMGAFALDEVSKTYKCNLCKRKF